MFLQLSCMVCELKSDMPESQVKGILLKCKGNPLKIKFVDPGGPFFERTEIWYYSSDEKSGGGQYWFANRLCISKPNNEM